MAQPLHWSAKAAASGTHDPYPRHGEREEGGSLGRGNVRLHQGPRSELPSQTATGSNRGN
jgi:hypothetical protein